MKVRTTKQKNDQERENKKGRKNKETKGKEIVFNKKRETMMLK